MTRFLLCCLLVNALSAQTPEALRKHVSYLASDDLRGRPLPSSGLDSAALYIAAQFKSAGLEPIGADGFFQNYQRTLMRPDFTGYEFTIHDGPRAIPVLPTELLPFSSTAMKFDNAELVRIDPENGPWLLSLKRPDIEGKIVAVRIVSQAESEEKQENFKAAMDIVSKFSPALTLMYGPTAAALDVPGVLLEPGQAPPTGNPRFPVRTDAFRALIESLPAGPTKLRVTLHLRAAVNRTLKLSNVAGLLRGSDPALGDTYEVVTANYDGFPTRRLGDDPVSNSANANASGVAALIEAARSLAAGHRPKRSILFLATSGETPEGPGAKYYREHPLVPLEKTIACFNLLQLGRTDSSDGPKLMGASITGFTRSPLPALFQAAGEPVGIRFSPDRDRDAEMARGFQPLLLPKKVPSHTIYVAFNFPDLHRASDEAGKLDYANMSKVVQAIAAGLARVADTGVQ